MMDLRAGRTISRSGVLGLLIDRITGRDGRVGLLLMGPLGEQSGLTPLVVQLRLRPFQ
jgi:hypothetical protein